MPYIICYHLIEDKTKQCPLSFYKLNSNMCLYAQIDHIIRRLNILYPDTFFYLDYMSVGLNKVYKWERSDGV